MAAQQHRYTYGTSAPKLVPEVRPRPRFQVHEGEGSNASNNKALNHRAIAIFQVVILCAGAAFILSLARIGLTASCVSELQTNAALRQEVSQAQDDNRSLNVENAVLSNNSRISTIAEQNYGMVYVQPGNAETITIG